MGIQVFGGYDYTREYSQEQYLRDCKITHICEGTNGIQAKDLLGSKHFGSDSPNDILMKGEIK